MLHWEPDGTVWVLSKLGSIREPDIVCVLALGATSSLTTREKIMNR